MRDKGLKSPVAKTGKRKKKSRPTSKQEVSKDARKAESQTDIDFETMVRDEYQKLLRRYRVMEDARHSIAGQTGKLTQKVSIFRRWENERVDLMTDLQNAACYKNKETDKQTIRTILDILEVFESKKSKLERAYTDIAEMEENVDKITKRLVDQKLKVQKLYGMSLSKPKVEAWKDKLENRLYNVTTQFDTCVSKNKVLHSEIAAMLQIRGKFFRRVLTIKKLSGVIKHKMGGIVFEATSTYEQRDDWVSKTASLRERNDKDSRQHVLEIKELQRVLHSDSKTHDFLEHKNRERVLLESLRERQIRKNAGKIAILDETLENYKRSFNSILKRSKNKDIDSLVIHYLWQEEQNYAVFKYVTDLNHENCCHKEQIKTIKKDIEEQYTLKEELGVEQTRELKNLQNVLKEEKESFKTVIEQFKESDELMDEFGHLLNTAFGAAGCSNNSIVAHLGNQGGIKPQNICLCVSVLEHRVSELVYEMGRLEVQKSVEVDGLQLPKRPQFWMPGVKPKPQGGPFKPKHMVTGRMDAEQDEEEQDDKHSSKKPIYFKELYAHLLTKLVDSNVPGSSMGDHADFQDPVGDSASIMKVELDDYKRKPQPTNANPSTVNKTT